MKHELFPRWNSTCSLAFFALALAFVLFPWCHLWSFEELPLKRFSDSFRVVALVAAGGVSAPRANVSVANSDNVARKLTLFAQETDGLVRPDLECFCVVFNDFHLPMELLFAIVPGFSRSLKSIKAFRFRFTPK